MNPEYCDLRVLIIEDVEVCAFLLREQLFKLGFKHINIIENAEAGIIALNSNPPDILFLDITLSGEFDGIDVMKYILSSKIHTHVIITSDHNDHMKEVIRYSPIDFLEKPIDFSELVGALKKIFAHLEIHHANKELRKVEVPKLVEIQSNNETRFYRPDEVAYLEADGSYSRIVLTTGEEVIFSQNLGKLYANFQFDNFIRVSRKHVINKMYVRILDKKKNEIALGINGKIYVIVVSKKYLPKTFL